MSTKARKEAYLRRHNLRSPRPSVEVSEGEETSAADLKVAVVAPVKPKSPGGEGERSWAEKRKDHVLHRRPSREAHPPPAAVAASPDVKPAKAASPRTPTEPSWAQKRKEHLLKRAGAEPAGFDVALTAVQFAARLKLGASNAAAATGKATGSPPSEPSSAASSPREKSWAQRRKESYLARYARSPPAQAQVAVAAVAFAVKLKRQAKKADSEIIKEEVAAASRAAAASSTAAQPEGTAAVEIS